MTHISQCLVTDLVSSYLQKWSVNQNVIQFCFRSSTKATVYHFKENLKDVQENASLVSVLFTFKHSLISYFATHNQQTTNYRLALPRVLQTFSINCKTDSGTGSFVCLSVHCMCVYVSVHSAIGVSLSRNTCTFHCRSDFVCANVLVYTYVCLGCAHVCSNFLKKQSDTQSPKGVKINALFTFAILSSNKSIHWFE